MTSDPRSAALEQLRALRERLGSDAAVDECDHLIRAVEAFHMEGVRFRMYGLRRRLSAGDAPAGDDVLQRLDTAGDALRDAGFGIR